MSALPFFESLLDSKARFLTPFSKIRLPWENLYRALTCRPELVTVGRYESLDCAHIAPGCMFGYVAPDLSGPYYLSSRGGLVL